MKIEYTRKLFFRKYSYKLTFLIQGKSSVWYKAPSEIRKIPKWVETHLPDTDVKIIKRYQGWDDNKVRFHQSVYCKDQDTKDKLLAQFGLHILEICQPLDNNHKDNLEVKNVIEVRKNLIFKKYRYAVYFKYDKKNEIFDWLGNYFQGHATAKVSGNKWWPKLYLTDETEIMSVRLSWQECIDYIKTVRCLDEISIAP